MKGQAVNAVLWMDVTGTHVLVLFREALAHRFDGRGAMKGVT